MKRCNNCGQTYNEDLNFCTQCGRVLETIVETVEEPNKVCPNCGAVIEDENALFCYSCGAIIKNDFAKQEASVQSIIKNTADKVKENEFVKSVKQDLENSQSLNVIKNKAQEGFNSAVDVAKGATQKVKSMNAAKKTMAVIIAGAVAVVMVVLIVVTNIHTCDECDKTYFGKEYRLVSVWGNSESVCKDCYNRLSW